MDSDIMNNTVKIRHTARLSRTHRARSMTIFMSLHPDPLSPGEVVRYVMSHLPRRS
ncbi:hypothetical protein MA3A0122S_4240 [Mycobacteroides abscessus 3A-0122-S]|nr:hypothetical protein MA3A0122S_4240 [Mycobacteroides abscessus 3A-0122-S]